MVMQNYKYPYKRLIRATLNALVGLLRIYPEADFI